MIFCYIWWIYQSFLVRDGSWFIYLDKLVLALKHNHPPWQNWPENMTCTQKSTLWHWFTPLHPHPRLSNTHTPTCIHSPGLPLWRGIGWVPLLLNKFACPHMFPLPFCPKSINVDFVIFMQFLAILFKILSPLSKSQPIWETMLSVSSTFVNKRQVSKQSWEFSQKKHQTFCELLFLLNSVF